MDDPPWWSEDTAHVAERLRDAVPRLPRPLLGKALEIAASLPDVRARHALMLRVILRLHAEERAMALGRLRVSLDLHDTPEGRVAIFTELLEQGWPREARGVARPLLDTLDAMPSPDGDALRRLIPWLDASDLDRAVTVAARSAPETRRAEALAALLARPDLEGRTAVVRALRDSLPLRDVAPSRLTAVMEAVARSLPREDVAAFLPLVAAMPEGRDRALAPLGSRLDASVEDTAVDLTFALADPRQRRGALAAIAAHAPPGRSRKLLARVIAGPDEERRSDLATVVTSLPPLAVADIVVWSHSDLGGVAVTALVAALHRIGAPSLPETLSLLRLIPDPHLRGEALVRYAVHAAPRAGLPRGALLAEACETLRADPRVVSFFRRWGDRLRVISVEEVLPALHAPERLLRLVWPNIAAFRDGAPPGVLPFLREIAPPSQLADISAALAEVSTPDGPGATRRGSG